MKNHEKNYDAVNAHEQIRLLSHNVAEVIETIFYGNDKNGLELLIRHLEFFVEHARSCVSCLEFVGQGENPYKKIKLLLGYLGHEGISEDFAAELEDMTDQVNEYLETDEENEEQMKEAEEAALENMRKLLDEAERRATVEAEVELGA